MRRPSPAELARKRRKAHQALTQTTAPDTAGKDATSEYDDVGHSKTAHKMMAEYLIGEYEGGDSAPEGTTTTHAPPGALQTVLQYLLPVAIILLALYVRSLSK